MQKNKRTQFGVVVIFLLMFLSPFIENTRGIFIPIFKEEFSVSNTLISGMITGVSLLGMGVTFLGGAITERIGQRKTIFLGILLLLGGILIQSQAPTFFWFFLGFIPIIAGINLYNVAANTLVPILFAGTSTLAMNLFHFMYGAGSTVSQNAIGFLLERNVTWRSIYVYIAVLYLLILLVFRFTHISDAPKVEGAEKGPNLLKSPLLYAFGFALGFYVFAEQGLSLWLTNYLKVAFGFKESLGARYIGIFFLVFALGRFFGGFLVQKTGVLRSVLVSQILALLTLTAGIILGETYVIVISISGLFFAVVYPSLLSLVTGIFRERPGYATGMVITLIALVNNLMTLLMGILTDLLGEAKSIYMLPLSLVLSILLVVYIRKEAEKRKSLTPQGQKAEEA